MTVREFYKDINGDYDGTLARMLKEDRIIKFLGRFYQDHNDYENMLTGLDSGDWELAFRSSHNLKGMALNLGLGQLATDSSAFCEILREKVKSGALPEPLEPKLSIVKDEYAATIDKLAALLG